MVPGWTLLSLAFVPSLLRSSCFLLTRAHFQSGPLCCSHFHIYTDTPPVAGNAPGNNFHFMKSSISFKPYFPFFCARFVRPVRGSSAEGSLSFRFSANMQMSYPTPPTSPPSPTFLDNPWTVVAANPKPKLDLSRSHPTMKRPSSCGYWELPQPQAHTEAEALRC